MARFPKELEQYSPSLVPLHSGTHMNMAVMRRAGQFIMVNTDLFSGYITATFIETDVYIAGKQAGETLAN